MSVGRVSGDYEYNKKPVDSSLNNQEDINIFDSDQAVEDYSSISSKDNSLSSQELNLSSSSDYDSSFQDELNQAIIDYLDNLVSAYEQQFSSVKTNNGIIAKGWDWFKNATGIGAGSDKIQDKINQYKKQINELKSNSSNLIDVYKSITGNELNDEELNNLINGNVDLSNSDIVESVSKYSQGQKLCTNVISGITSSLAVVGLVAGGILTAPFSVGMSLGASFAAIGSLTAAGTAAYMLPQVVDGITEKDGYTFKEGIEDVANGIVNSAFTATGIGAGKAIGEALGKNAVSQAAKKAAALAAGEATSVIIGDGIAVGNYLVETAVNEDVDFSLTDLAKVTASSTAASLAAGGAAVGVNSALRPILTSGTSAQSQIIGRLLSAGISGGSAGAAASFTGAGTNYFVSCNIDGKDVSFDEWLNASTENLASASITGFLGGIAFEAVHLAAGTPKPEGSVKTVKGTNEDGLKYTNYLDKDGNVIATDVSKSDFAKAYSKYSNNEQQGMIEYGDNTQKTIYDAAFADNTRTIRFSISNLNTQIRGNNTINSYIETDMVYDWADNVTAAKVTPHINIFNNNYSDLETSAFKLGGNSVNTPQLTQGSEAGQEAGLIPAQNDSVNINSKNVEIVDTTLAQLSVQQAQMANIQSQIASVQAQTQGAIISSVNPAGSSVNSSLLKSDSTEITQSLGTTPIPSLQKFFEFNENAIQVANFSELSETGISLSYSTKSFLKEMMSILNNKNITTLQKREILKKIGMEVPNGKIVTTYTGILDISQLNVTSERLAELRMYPKRDVLYKNAGDATIEEKVALLVDEYINNNSFNTGIAELDSALNEIIKTMPEIINIIGRPQHKYQKYSLDIHTFKVLQNVLNNPQFHLLTEEEQTVLISASLLHDIGKRAGIKTDNHPEISSELAKNIMEKNGFSQEIIDKVCKIIEKHHWSSKYDFTMETKESILISEFDGDAQLQKLCEILALSDIKAIDDLSTNSSLNWYNNVLSLSENRPIYEITPPISITANVSSSNADTEIKNNGYVSSFKEPGLSSIEFKQQRGQLLAQMLERIKNNETLTDSEILDIWAYKKYMELSDYPEIQERYIAQFNQICEKGKITTHPNEILVRTIPVTIDTTNGPFAIGKPKMTGEGYWPAAAARMRINPDGKIENGYLIDRIIKDKREYLTTHPELNESGNIQPTTIFIIESGSEELTGFDWEQTGVINGENGNMFGSSIFRKEVNEDGYSTEVDFSGNTKFIVNPDKPMTTHRISLIDGQEFDINIVYIIPYQE